MNKKSQRAGGARPEPEAPSGNQAGPLAVTAQSGGVAVGLPLSTDEKERLARLEEVVDAKLGEFFEVGGALMEIKAKELFRETHSNFNLYCQDRWGFGRSYANKLIGSAERILLLPEGLPKPANEFQIRPFLKLEPGEFAKKWPAIIESAGAGKVTSKIVEDTLNLRRKKRSGRKAKAPDRIEGLKEHVDALRAALQEKNYDEALKNLSRLEKLLLS